MPNCLPFNHSRTFATFFLLTCTVLFSSTSFAQTFSLSGTFRDSKDQSTLAGVAISLSPASDTNNYLNTLSDVDGNFNFTGLTPGNYLLRANYLGYRAFRQTYALINSDLTLGNLNISSARNRLQGVTVTATQVATQQSGDTTAFNAGAYKTNPDANAEDLITKMPGITSENGAIKMNGEDVKKILVDGKEFFGDDPNAAIKNLPAEIIDKIQVFDKASDQAAFSGFDDGNSQKTINIVTKRGKNNGVFGKVTGGYGADFETGDDRYTVGGNINFFKGDRRITLVGLANNVNQQNFSSEDLLGVSSGSGGGGRGRSRAGGQGGTGGSYSGSDPSSNFLVSQQGGITTTQSAGINYSDQWSPKLKVSASYFFNRGVNENNTTLTRNYIVSDPDSALQYRETGLNTGTNVNHRATARLEWTIDSSNTIIFQPRVSYQSTETSRDLLGISALTDEHIAPSISSNSYSTSQTGYNLSNVLTYRHRFAKQGRTISLSLNSGYNEKSGNGSIYASNYYGGTDTFINDQQYTLESDGLNLSANLSYTEPLSKNAQLLVTYNPSLNKNNSDRHTYNRGGQYYDQLDTLLSNVYDNRYYYHRGGVGYRYSKDKINFNASLNAQYATLSGTQDFPNPLNIDRNFSDLLPQFNFNYKFSKTENIRIFYRSSTNPPSISQLQGIVDNSNPLLLRTGNPDLRQDYSHNLSVRYGKTGGQKGTGLFLFANGGYTAHYIGNSTFIALKDTVIAGTSLNRGSQLTKPVNIDGNWSARSFVTYAFPVKAIKTNLNLNAGVNYNRIPAIINGARNNSDNYIFNAGFVASSNISENLDFTLSSSGAYNIVENSLEGQGNFNYYSQNSSARINWIFLNRAQINTTLSHTWYEGLEASYNQNFLLWNASIGYKFLKNKSLLAEAYIFDILKQNRAIARTVTDSYIEDSRTDVLQRYGMLRLTYTLRAFKKDAPKMEDEGGPRMRP
jgi:hypothetical protein